VAKSGKLEADLEGEVVLPCPVDLDRALLIVRLRDTSMSDAPAPLLGLTRRVVSGKGIDRLSFTLRVRRTVATRQHAAIEAELRWMESRRLLPGDLLTTVHVLAYPDGERRFLQVPVTRIR
jgi:uncharacterized lipoprotein YbaY